MKKPLPAVTQVAANTEKLKAGHERITRAELHAMYATLMKNPPESTDYSVNWNISKNMRVVLKPIAEAIEDMKMRSLDFLEYQRKRAEICQKYAIKDDVDNTQLTADNRYDIAPDKREKAREELGKLRDEYEKAIEEENLRTEKLLVFLQGTEDVVFHKTPASDFQKAFQKNPPTPKVLMFLHPMIQE